MPNYKLLSNDVSDFCVSKVPVIETEKLVFDHKHFQVPQRVMVWSGQCLVTIGHQAALTFGQLLGPSDLSRGHAIAAPRSKQIRNHRSFSISNRSVIEAGDQRSSYS